MKRSIVSIMMLLVSSFHVVAQDTISSIHISQKRVFFSRNLLVPATLITSGAIAEINFRPSLDAELFKERNTDNSTHPKNHTPLHPFSGAEKK